MTSVRFAGVADPHLWNHGILGGTTSVGINDRCQHHLEALKRAVEAARDRRCDTFVILGDLYDGTRPSPQLIAQTQAILEAAPQPIALLGNHEMVSTKPGDHALAPLYPVAKVIEVPTILHIEAKRDREIGEVAPGLSLVLVPYQPGPADEWLPGVLEGLDPPAGSLMCMHLGIRGKDVPGYLAGAHDSVAVDLVADLLERYDLAACFAGNWHERRIWKPKGRPIVQVGTLCPTGWDNPGWANYGYMAYWDSKAGGESISIPGPRFVKVRSEADFQAALAGPTREGDILYLEWVAPAAELAYASDLIRQTPGIMGRAVPDREAQQAAATRAAVAASSAETLEGALASWVAEMELPEGVGRQGVLERCKAYLVGRSAA